MLAMSYHMLCGHREWSITSDLGKWVAWAFVTLHGHTKLSVRQRISCEQASDQLWCGECLGCQEGLLTNVEWHPSHLQLV